MSEGPLDYPIVRIELESMRQTLQHAFSGQVDEIKKIADRAIAEALDPEKILYLARDNADRMLSSIVAEQVKNWFLTSDGSKLILDEVRRQLDEMAGRITDHD